jgi:PTH1 family peptidyl-tRNA hydrolase
VKAVFGLGNPGSSYRRTRHNAGFRVVEELIRRDPVRWRGPRPAKFGSETALVAESDDAILAMPQMYMNRSGPCVKEIVGSYGIGPADLLVVCDDADLPCGEIRLRPGGSSGGQRGLQSVLDSLGTEAVPRLRVGIGRSGAAGNLTDRVLGPFDPAEEAVMNEAVPRAAEAIEYWCRNGMDAAMNRYNAGARPPEGPGPK